MKKAPVPEESKIEVIRQTLKLGLITYNESLIQKYGDILYDKLFPGYLISHPDFVKYIYHDNAQNYFTKRSPGYKLISLFIGKGMITSNNYDIWKKDRAIAEPAFYLPQLQEHAALIVQNCLEILNDFEAAAKNQTPVDLPSSFTEMTMHNLITTIIKNVNINHKQFNQATRDILEQLFYRQTSITKLPWILPTHRKRKLDQALKLTDALIRQAIKDRLQQSDPGDDLLGKYLKGYAAESDLELKINHIRDEMITFIFAGHETIAATMAWALVCLSQHPESERRVLHEIDTVLNGRLPTYNDLKSLPYTRAILSEVLRLYPVVPYISRTALEEDEIMGYHIPKGSNINTFIYHIHHHPDFWNNPEGFDPERFVKNPWYQHQQFAFIPGSAGERHCIGIHYALMEGYLSLITLLQRYQLSLLPGANVKPVFYITLWPEGGLKMMVKKR